MEATFYIEGKMFCNVGSRSKYVDAGEKLNFSSKKIFTFYMKIKQ